MIQSFYTFILYPLIFVGFWISSRAVPKIKLGFQVRAHKGWLRASLPQTSPVYWFHVASGELEYAKPVFRELKRAEPDSKILVTFFSPSVISSLEKTKEVDVFVPTPWDTPWHWREFLDHYHPVVLAVARTDTWPNMIWETEKRGIPRILFAATLPSQSGRVASFWGRLLYGSVVDSLSHVSCVSREDEDNFRRLSSSVSLSVDGDTRYDQVSYRLLQNQPLKSFRLPGRPLFVAGSTWPSDEAVLLPALRLPLKKGWQVVIAPHEPTAHHLQELEKNFTSMGIVPVRYSRLKGPEQVVLIDQVGLLADLYRTAQVALVGGGFKKSVHSVMEPASAGCLILFGPFHFNSREALQLKSTGLAQEITTAHDVETILVNDLSLSAEKIEERKQRLLKYVEHNQGVSSKVAAWIKTHRRY